MNFIDSINLYVSNDNSWCYKDIVIILIGLLAHNLSVCILGLFFLQEIINVGLVPLIIQTLETVSIFVDIKLQQIVLFCLDCLHNIDVTTDFYYSNILLCLVVVFYALVSLVSCLRFDCNDFMLLF